MEHTMDEWEQMANNNNATNVPPSMEQTFHAFMQQMVQSNAINQQTLQGLQNVL
jgi:hypothetical protein